MDCLFLHCLNLQSIQLLIKHLGKRQSKMSCVQAALLKNLSSALNQNRHPGKSHLLPFSVNWGRARPATVLEQSLLLTRGHCWYMRSICALHRNKPSEHTAHLTQIHYNALMDLLPQVSSENLDERNLQRGDLAVHKDARQIQLHLKPNVHLQRKRSCENKQYH